MLPNASIPKRLSMIVENGLIAGPNLNEIPNKGSRKSIEFVRNFSFLIHENRIFCLFPYSRGYAYAKTRMKIAIFIRVLVLVIAFAEAVSASPTHHQTRLCPCPSSHVQVPSRECRIWECRRSVNYHRLKSVACSSQA